MSSPAAPQSFPPPNPGGKSTPAGGSRAVKSASGKPDQPEDSWRDTIESVVLAFVLAFLFRTFEAEAFVIPTGSMAPTLYGQHRDVVCEQCKFHYTVGFNANEELKDGMLSQEAREHSSICPNCRFPNNVLASEIFTGDRILVNKVSYDLRDPQRWDTLVFKFPGEPKTNYIKRLVGLPGEELKFDWGDVRVRPLKSKDLFRIPRKVPDKQRALQLPVYDDDHPPEALLAAGWPERWSAQETKAWSPDRKARSFRLDPDPTNAGNWQWMRYRHLVPSSKDWDAAIKHTPLTDKDPKPLVITDMYAYNAQISNMAAMYAGGNLPELPAKDDGLQWVGDLTINGTAEVLAPEGELQFELVEGSRRYRCRIDLKTGKGEFSFIDDLLSKGKEEIQGSVEFETPMNKAGKFRFSFANVDNRLCLWINDHLIKTLEFEPGASKFPEAVDAGPTDADLSPVGIAGRGAKVVISNLRLERDIYYRFAAPNNVDEFHPSPSDPASFRELLQNPEALSKGYLEAKQAISSRLPPHGPQSPASTYPYQLHDYADNDLDEFLVLGDNSPRSNDSRLWENSPCVERRLLIGKAFWIYWPHGDPFLNKGQGYHVMYYRAEPSRPITDSAGNNLSRGPEPDAPTLSLPFQPNWERWWKRIR